MNTASSISIGCRIVAEFDDDASVPPPESEGPAVGAAGNGVTIEQLRAAHRATLFRPFTLHLADGRQLRVPGPELLSHSPSGRTIIVIREDDSFAVVDLPLVTNLEVHVPRSPDGQSA